MLDSAIENFLSARKAVKVNKNLKPGHSDKEKQSIELVATDLFLLANRLPDAAKQAEWLSMVSPPGRFIHSNAKTSAVIANARRTIDTCYLECDDANIGPIAVEPYGATTNLGKAKDKADFYSVFGRFTRGEKLSGKNDEHYMMAVLALGESGKD
ncbi:MAG: type I-F CRISPR-associated protein Cas7f/Csy3 [Methylobacter sp.]